MKKNKEFLEFTPAVDYYLAAISCHQKCHRFAWELNNALDCSFERVEDYEVITKKGQTAAYRMFEWREVDDRFSYVLLQNKSNFGPLIPEHAKMDFLFAVAGIHAHVNAPDLLKRIKQINDVVLAYEVDAEKTESAQNLILE